MHTTIDDAKLRLEYAEKVQKELEGEDDCPSSLSVTFIDDFVVVDDGADRWLAESSDYEYASEKVVGDILDGVYDSEIVNQEAVDWYSDVCNNCCCIFSRMQGSDPKELLEILKEYVSCPNTSTGDEIVEEILETLGVDYETEDGEIVLT